MADEPTTPPAPDAPSPPNTGHWERNKHKATRRVEEQWQHIQHQFDTPLTGQDIVSANRWMVTLIFAFCLQSAFRCLEDTLRQPQTAVLLPGMANDILPWWLTALFLGLFLTDMARMLIPLAFCSGIIRANAGSLKKDVIPETILWRLIVIYILTFVFLFLAARSINFVFGYALFIMATQLTDLLWYRKLRKPDAVIERATQRSMTIVKAVSSQHIRDVSDKAEVREVADFVASSMDGIHARRVALLKKWKETIARLNTTIDAIETHNRYAWIAATDVACCLLVCALSGLPYLSGLFPYLAPLTTHTQLLAWAARVCVILHVLNTLYDCHHNKTEYITMIKLMLTKDTEAPNADGTK